MGHTAALFPGQGSQFVGMGRDIFERSPAGRAVFEKADEALGFSLSKVIFEGPEEELTRTDISQPAILTVSTAVVEAAREAGWKPKVAAAAGLSLGEYSALVFAGAIPFEQAVVLVHRRGAFMREAGAANPGGMLSVMGLEEEAVMRIVQAASAEGEISIANLNCPGQIVLSGEAGPLESAAEMAAEEGAFKTVFLKVDGAFHSPLMQPAAARLAAELERHDFVEAELPVVANRAADYARDPEDIKRFLVEQITSGVLWEGSMRRLLDDGVTDFVELGPGRVLAGLMKRIARKAPVLPVGDMDTALQLAGARAGG